VRVDHSEVSVYQCTHRRELASTGSHKTVTFKDTPVATHYLEGTKGVFSPKSELVDGINFHVLHRMVIHCYHNVAHLDSK
jgi:hypothetical protein